MATKSVVQIDIDDAAFKRYTTLYEKYNTALGKQAGLWKAAGAQTLVMTPHLQKMAAAQLAAAQATQQMAAAQAKAAASAQQQATAWSKKVTYSRPFALTV